jgi:hypothetical protein
MAPRANLSASLAQGRVDDLPQQPISVQVYSRQPQGAGRSGYRVASTASLSLALGLALALARVSRRPVGSGLELRRLWSRSHTSEARSSQLRETPGPQARALVDRAVGELARLDAALGRTAALDALFADLGKRPITGSATEAVQGARELLTVMRRDPKHLFNCGPMALRLLMLARGAGYKQVEFLQWYRSGANGTSLAEIGQLAAKAGLPYHLVFRKPGEPVPMPAIVHWKVGISRRSSARRTGAGTS